MTGGKKIWSTVVDYFLILGSIIGVGFASGKEIEVFFFSFGKASMLGVLFFALLYAYLYLVIQHIKRKLKINSYNQFNTMMFGKICKITNVVLLINFSIAASGMLAGAESLISNFTHQNSKFVSVILSTLTFFILLGGIKKVKLVANVIIPIMISIIVINSIINITPENVNFEIVEGNGLVAVYYGLLFGVNNFVAGMPVLFETKLHTKGKLAVVATISAIILLNILILACGNYTSSMPLLSASENGGKVFYVVYFLTLVCALFSTLVICSFNMQTIISPQKNIFATAVIVLFNLILSNVGYEFIVKYLYVASGVISGIYVVVLCSVMMFKLLTYKKNKTPNS